MSVMKRFWAFYASMPFILMTVFVGLGVASSSAAAPGKSADMSEVTFVTTPEAIDPNLVLKRVNEKRLQQNIAALTTDQKLGTLAQARADDMARRNYYSHKNPDGKYYYDYFQNHGIKLGYNCENLVLISEENIEQVVLEWQTSTKGHLECMMNNKTTLAGYGTGRISHAATDGSTEYSYIVVAVHAQSSSN
jgi:uncharacterized protein YkwD